MEKEHQITQTLKQTAKKSIFRTIFSRSFIFASLLLLQLFTYFILLSSIIITGNVKYVLSVVITVIAGFIIINKNDNPMYTITWLFLILGFPVFGIFIYLFVSIQPQAEKRSKLYRKEYTRTKSTLIPNQENQENLKKENKNIYNLSNYLYKYSGTIFDNYSKTEFLNSGESKFEALKKDLLNAKKFIFIEYFIIGEGYMWESILEILKQKAQEGVEIRVMYDGTCTYSRLPIKYPKELASYGIKCKVFSPIRPVFTTYQNNRDHRKIVVIDGDIAYTGGINLSDEYINLKQPYGQWRDASIRICGKATDNFTLMFLQIWNMREKEKETFDKYINIASSYESDGFVTGYGDTPYDNERIGENVYLSMINSATNYVHIITPYLVPSYEMIQALTFAAKRGVDVKIIMPSNPDKKYAFWLARNYYYPLIENGVQIYEWQPGFIHSKIFIVDDIQAVVGTINMDFRSLFLHLECGSYLYKNSQISVIEKDFQDVLTQCTQIDLDFLNNLPFIQKFCSKLLKLFAPLL